MTVDSLLAHKPYALGIPEVVISKSDLTDSEGTLIGYRITTVSSFETLIEDYDLADQLIRSSSLTADGYKATRIRSDRFDLSGIRSGEIWTGTWSDGTTQSEWTDVFDLNGNLLSSVSRSSDGHHSTWIREDRDGWHAGLIPISYALQYRHFNEEGLLESSEDLYSVEGWLLSVDATDRDGSTRSYRLTPVMGEDGSTNGYVGVWNMTSGTGETTYSTDFFDLDMNWMAPQVEPVPEPLISEVILPGDPDPRVVICEFPPPKPYAESENGIPADGMREVESRLLAEISIKPAVLEPLVCEPGLQEPIGLKPITKGLGEIGVTMALPSDSSDEVNSSTAAPQELVQVTALVGGVVSTQSSQSTEEPGLRSGTRHLDLGKGRHRSVRKAELTGEKHLNLRGNRHDNVLIGNAGDNRIEGGRGEDTCTGGAGADLFVLSGARASHDWLTDFNPEEDRLVLKGQRFKGLFRKGTLRDGVIGNQLVWDGVKQALLFDRDGASGQQQPIMLAVIPSLSGIELNSQNILPWSAVI